MVKHERVLLISAQICPPLATGRKLKQSIVVSGSFPVTMKVLVKKLNPAFAEVQPLPAWPLHPKPTAASAGLDAPAQSFSAAPRPDSIALRPLLVREVGLLTPVSHYP